LETPVSEPHPTPFFVGDDLALDFLNSVAVPGSEEIEWLANGDDFVAWLEQAHAVPTSELSQICARSGSRALDAVASEARELREWFRGFVGKHAGEPLRSPALRELKLLNQLLERDDIYRQIAATPSHDSGEHERSGHQALRWQTRRRWQNARTLLLPIAEAIGDLICQQDFTLVRKCEGPTCTLWFLDVSKGHARRWCSMAVCGNRAKVATHRARARHHRIADISKSS
jgi:predicted RNA-binding Zn ribbon-like protein